MAKASRIFCFNLGMQRIGAAEFRPLPDGGLMLQAYKQTELIADPGADATRAGQLKIAVAELQGELGIKGSPIINYALPSQAVFARFVKLPATSAETVVQIIGFEAQQNVPFPIDEVIWDYQVIGSPVDGKIDAVLVAIKADQLTEINDSVEAAKLRPGVIDVAPMALYNAFRFNYANETGCSLLIDIGARTTNLIFIEGQRVFSRSIPMGGSTISSAVAKEFVEDFAVAEELKKQKGFVGLGGAYEEPSDPKVAKISKLIRNTMTRLHAEIARSISFYRTNQGGSQPVRVFLAGGTVSFPYMREFFGEKLQLPVEHFNPLRNVVVSPSADVDLVARNAHTLGELVGMALRAVGSCPLELNLRPRSVVRTQDLARRKPFLLAAAACLFLALGGLWVYFNQAVIAKGEMLTRVQGEVSGLEGFAKQIDAITLQRKQLEKIANPLITVISERAAWLEIINQLGEKLPRRSIWITKMQPTIDGQPVAGMAGMAGTDPRQASPSASRGRDGNKGAPMFNGIMIQGLYMDDPQVVEEFVNNLSQSPLFELDESNRAKHLTRSQPDNETWAYSYTIDLPLKQPIAIK